MQGSTSIYFVLIPIHGTVPWQVGAVGTVGALPYEHETGPVGWQRAKGRPSVSRNHPASSFPVGSWQHPDGTRSQGGGIIVLLVHTVNDAHVNGSGDGDCRGKGLT